MTTVSTVLRRTALVLTSLFALGGLLFALGYAFEDPGGWVAAALAAAVFVPLGLLTFLAARRPRTALTVLTVAVALYAAWGLLGLFVDLVDAPDVPVIALVLAVPIAVVGLRSALRAGGLMMALAAVPFVLVLVRLVRESGPEGPGLGDLLGGSTGAVVAPLAVLGALLLVAGVLDRPEPGADPQQAQPQPPQVVQPH